MAVSLRAVLRSGLLAAAVSMLVSGCGGAAQRSATTPAGSLIVFLGPGLQSAMGVEVSAFESAYPGTNVTLNFGEGHLMLGRLLSGAPCDVLALAGDGEAQAQKDGLLAAPPRVLARDTLEIVVASGNPKGIHGLADLARPDLRVALVSPSTPLGAATAQVLHRAGVQVPDATVVDEEGPAFSAVVLGEADATIVHPTDVIGASLADAAKVAGITIPPADNETVAYSIAVTKHSPNPVAAAAFVAEMLSPQGQARLRRQGYLPP